MLQPLFIKIKINCLLQRKNYKFYVLYIYNIISYNLKVENLVTPIYVYYVLDDSKTVKRLYQALYIVSYYYFFFNKMMKYKHNK